MKSWLALCLAVAVVSAVGVPTAHADGLFAKKQVLFDEELAISSSGSQMRGFTLNRSATVEVAVKGIKNTDKGFDVYLMTAEDYEHFKQGKAFEHFPDFHGLKVTGSVNTHDVPPGSYALVVFNKYNLMRGMVVHVKLTINP